MDQLHTKIMCSLRDKDDNKIKKGFKLRNLKDIASNNEVPSIIKPSPTQPQTTVIDL